MPLASSGGSVVNSSSIVDDSIVNADVNSAAAIAYSKLSLANSITSGDMSQGVLKVDIVSLTATEIKALVASPKVLVAAPGAGKAILVESVFFSFTYNSVAMTNGDDVYWKYSTQGANHGAQILAILDLRGTANFVAELRPKATGYVYPVVNDSVVLKCAATEYATGNSTAKVVIAYRIVTV